MFKHIQAVTAKGKTYRYYRYGGQRIKLRGEPGSAEFSRSYSAASKKASKELRGFHRIIADYFGSVSFQKLAPRTQSMYLKHKGIIEAKWASAPLRTIDAKEIRRSFQAWHQELIGRHKARQADLIMATMRVILSHGVKSAILTHNHMKEGGYTAAYRADRSDAIWTHEDVASFVSRAGKVFQIAVIMALNLGRRMGDLIRISWADYDGTHIAVTNRKGGRRVRFRAECAPALKAALDAYRASLKEVAENSPILTSPTGRPWTESGFSSKFSAEKNSAGLQHLHFHDLRGTAITVLAEQGCTHPEIAAISGHSLKDVARIIDKYMAMTAALNRTATAKLSKSWISQIGHQF